ESTPGAVPSSPRKEMLGSAGTGTPRSNTACSAAATQQPQPSMQPTRPYHGPNYGARSSAIQQHQNHTIHTTRAPETVLTMPTMAT
ncbi:hypothetical protein, partial [Mycobacterium canetti]